MTKLSREAFVQITDHRPWGSFTVLSDEADHKVKRLVVRPGGRLSLQRHRHRREHWCIISGRAVITLDERQFELGPGESINVERGAVHRIRNKGDDDLVLIEIQLGDYFGEDDIERLQDDYGRTTTI